MAARLIASIILMTTLSGCSSPRTENSVRVSIAGETFLLELSVDERSRIRGLMDRTSIDPEGGMLFVFPDADLRSFWMSHCYIDIDLIFLDSRGTITAIHEMTVELPQEPDETPWEYESRLRHYWSNGPARFAIELAAGSIKRLDIHTNDRIVLDLPTLRSLAR